MLELLKYRILFITFILWCGISQCQMDTTHNLKTPILINNLTVDIYSLKEQRLIYNVSTLNQENITLSWKNSFAKKTKTKWFVRLQYRLGEDSIWKDVKDKNNRNIEFVTTQKRYTKVFENINLPEECHNQDFVQIAFLINTFSKTKSGYPIIVFKQLQISSFYDEFWGTPAKVDVSKHNCDTCVGLTEILFDRIPIPFVYPESKKIVIESANIRDSITLKLVGADANNFSLSHYSINNKTPKKIITVNYIPKKEGKHKTILQINTTKLSRPIEIKLEGVSAKRIDYNENMLPNNTMIDNYLSYNIPVFSNTDYQYRIEQAYSDFQQIRIRYRWYRDDKLLFSMYDTVKKIDYCVSLQSPDGATNLEIELTAANDIILKDYYLGLPRVKTMIKSGRWTESSNWKPKGQPVIEDFVVIDKNVKALVDDDVACHMLILSDSANVSINTGKIFYISNDIFYNKNSYFTVRQHILPNVWNYISSPVNQVRAAIFSMKNNSFDNDTWFMQYNTGKKSKLDDYWSEYITDPEFTLRPAKGYAVYTHQPIDVKYEGLLCNSNVTIPLIWTKEDRWNLVGNPYTAPLSSRKLFEEIEGKIQGNTVMLLDKETKVYNPIIIDAKEEIMIPSLESFFVESLHPNDEITFKRKHQYIPSTSEQQWINNNYLRLSVTKDMWHQYVLLGMDDNAKKGFEALDCHKLFGNNENMPEIYLKDDKEEYSVCVFDSYPASYDIGLYAGNSADIELNVNNLSVLPDYVQILIEDKESKIFYDICSQGGIKTYLSKGTHEKYRIHILKSISFNKVKDDLTGIYVWQDKNRLLFFSNGVQRVEKFEIIKNDKIINSSIVDRKVIENELSRGKYTMKIYFDTNIKKEINIEMK